MKSGRPSFARRIAGAVTDFVRDAFGAKGPQKIEQKGRLVEIIARGEDRDRPPKSHYTARRVSPKKRRKKRAMARTSRRINRKSSKGKKRA